MPLVCQVVGHHRLAQLFQDRAVALLGERVLDELLRDRRRALRRAAGDIGHQRAPEAADVDPRVSPEALVLDADDRVLHRLRDLTVGVDHVVRRRREDPDRPPVIVVQVGVDLVSVLLLVLDLRQIGGDGHHHPEHHRDHGQDGQAGQDREQTQLAQLGLGRSAVIAAPEPAARRSEGDRRRRLRVLGLDLFVVAHAIGYWSGAGGRRR